MARLPGVLLKQEDNETLSSTSGNATPGLFLPLEMHNMLERLSDKTFFRGKRIPSWWNSFLLIGYLHAQLDADPIRCGWVNVVHVVGDGGKTRRVGNAEDTKEAWINSPDTRKSRSLMILIMTKTPFEVDILKLKSRPIGKLKAETEEAFFTSNPECIRDPLFQPIVVARDYQIVKKLDRGSRWQIAIDGNPAHELPLAVAGGPARSASTHQASVEEPHTALGGEWSQLTDSAQGKFTCLGSQCSFPRQGNSHNLQGGIVLSPGRSPTKCDWHGAL
jgi:hypothetical protein